MPDDVPTSRALTWPNVIAVAIGVVASLLVADRWTTLAGAFAAAALGGAVATLVWFIWVGIVRNRRIGAAGDAPRLGVIPPTNGGPAPVLMAPRSGAARAFRDAESALSSHAEGKVLLVTGVTPGHGASSVALNLAIAATQAGRRVVLIDGDPSGRGLTRFLHTAEGPGLAELARGEADLASASRLWELAPRTALPLIPAGAAHVEEADLRSLELADAFDTVGDGADLVLIDAPPLAWGGAATGLAAHADGALLVVADGREREAAEEAARVLAEAGAPVVGHVITRAGADRLHPSPPWRRMLKRGLATAVLSLVLAAGWSGYQIWNSWRDVQRNTYDVAAAESLLPLPAEGIVTDEVPEETQTVVTSPPAEPGRFTSFLVVGSDIGGFRADVIILVLISPRHDPVMVSIPRDLYLPNRCSRGYNRINAAFNGCGEEVNGPTLLALTVEDFTGIQVDHFALFDFDGFEAIIDELGGVEICVEYPVRDRKAKLDLDAGCTNATGAQALAWVRSRSTQELRNGVWRTMEGVNDLTRNERQQDLILQIFSKLKTFESPADLSRVVRSVSNAFTLDDQLGIGDAIALAWDLRDLDPSRVIRLSIPVRFHTTPEGAQVLVPTKSFAELMREEIPELATELA